MNNALAIPGSARDDFDRLKMLYLRYAQRDLSTTVSFAVARSSPRAGSAVGWTVTLTASSASEQRTGPSVTEVVAAWTADLARLLLFRWRADGGALQLCGFEPTPVDPPEPEIIDSPASDRDPAIERRCLSRAASA